VPLLRAGQAIGVIAVRRTEARPFTDRQVELLETFADQAVIAIENVRLFTELQEKKRALTEAHAQVTEALEQQTAASEILSVISSSPTDIQPVLDALVRSAVRFCGAHDAAIHRLDGSHLKVAAHHGPVPYRPIGSAIALVRGTINGRSVLERRPIHVIDLQAETEEFPEGSVAARMLGFRTALSVPLLREGVALGTINLRRAEAAPFTDKQIALLKTFADQAVIAIENVRLFTELQQRNGALTEALDRQTATSEILGVISRSQTDVQAVFDTIVRSAMALTSADIVALLRTDGEQIFAAASHGADSEPLREATLRLYPMPLDRDSLSGRAILSRAIQTTPDIETLPFPPKGSLNVAHTAGFRSQVTVPLLRGGEAIGALAVSRREPGAFPDAQVELLKTFSDQAVIAIENTRLQ
jgi:two-component system, NtrC family, sensor kinase